MILKLIGGILIVAASSLFGIAISNKYGNRPKELKKLRTSLQLLETEIIYGATPLPYAFENIGSKIEGVLRGFYLSASSNLKSGLFTSVSQAWAKAIESSMVNSSFSKADMELLRGFGNVLGSSDRADQQKHFKLFYAQLKHHEDIAEEDRRRNEKLYKSLGFLFGLAVFIILI